jgi:hypothetical protein
MSHSLGEGEMVKEEGLRTSSMSEIIILIVSSGVIFLDDKFLSELLRTTPESSRTPTFRVVPPKSIPTKSFCKKTGDHFDLVR